MQTQEKVLGADKTPKRLGSLLSPMTARVFWQSTDGGEPGDGAWYWCETDDRGEHIGDMIGPFETALEAGTHARKAIINRAGPLSSSNPSLGDKQ